MQANMKAEISRMKIRPQYAHLQATMLSEKLHLEDKVHELSFTIDQLRLDLNKSKVEAQSQSGALQRSKSFCQTKQECQSAKNDLEGDILGAAHGEKVQSTTIQGKTKKI